MSNVIKYKNIHSEEERKIALLEISSEIMDTTKSLFTIFHIEKYMGNKSAFVVRLHHVLGDGPSCFVTICSMADNWNKKIMPAIRKISTFEHILGNLGSVYYGNK